MYIFSIHIYIYTHIYIHTYVHNTRRSGAAVADREAGAGGQGAAVAHGLATGNISMMLSHLHSTKKR